MALHNLKNHRHRSLRLPGYEYTRPGAYFVTIVTWQRQCLFGEIVDGDMRLNEFGEIVAESWQWLPTQYPYVQIGAWCVMPNHFHGILLIDDVDPRRGGSRPAPTETIKIKPLGQLIGAFKTVSAKHINLTRNTSGAPVWQRNYYERIIRDEKELARIHAYIAANPGNWQDDEEN